MIGPTEDARAERAEEGITGSAKLYQPTWISTTAHSSKRTIRRNGKSIDRPPNVG